MSEPKWAQCVKRQEVSLLHRDGSKGSVCRCAHQASSHFAKDVTPETCAACPLRLITKDVRPPGFNDTPRLKREYAEPRLEEGRLVYEPNGLKPPSVPEGYARSGEEGAAAWEFVPVLPPCEDREMANTLHVCGCIKVNPMCGSAESKQRGQPVTADICQDCPVRRMMVPAQEG